MPVTGFTDLENVRSLLLTRPIDAHKGTMGHAAVIAGSYGMMGAAMLAAEACLRSGVGKLTCFATKDTYPILQARVPESIFQVCDPAEIPAFLEHHSFDAFGFGPGIGDNQAFINVLTAICLANKPLVLDADALNLISRSDMGIWNMIPPGTILTPHKGEFCRLFGLHASGPEMAVKYGIYIIMKGPSSKVCTPDGMVYENLSGNPGMATAGSGDVLTGILTGLLARGYSPLNACRVGVFIHGLAGDIASRYVGFEALIARDLLKYLPKAFRRAE